METRILTLFDDDDFLPKEEPKKRTAREAKTKETANSNIAQDDGLKETDPETPVNIAARQDGPLHTVAANQTAQGSNDIIDTPKNTLPEEHSVSDEAVADQAKGTTPDDEEIILNIGGTSPSGEEEQVAPDAVLSAADDELNRQILSELIQVDYTSLIHRDYPFDLNGASVATKKPSSETGSREVVQDNVEEQEGEVFEDVVPLLEWKLDKKYYTIGEVAQLFAVNTSHIRFWTNEFKLKPRTTRKGDRLYNPADIAELRLIHHLVKEKKHTIKGAKEKLKAGKNDVNTRLDLKDSLTNLRDTLLQIRAKL